MSEEKLVIFDLDNTILNGDSDYSMINFLVAKSILDDALLKNQESLTINLMKLKFKLKTSDSVDPSKDIDELLKIAKLSS